MNRMLPRGTIPHQPVFVMIDNLSLLLTKVLGFCFLVLAVGGLLLLAIAHFSPRQPAMGKLLSSSTAKPAPFGNFARGVASR